MKYEGIKTSQNGIFKRIKKLTSVGGSLSRLQKLLEFFHKPFDWQNILLSPFNLYPMGHDKEHFDGYFVWEHCMIGWIHSLPLAPEIKHIFNICLYFQ